MNYKCPVCDCHLYNTPLLSLAHIYERNTEGETVQVTYHASCLLGGSQISRLASMANSLGRDVQDYLQNLPGSQIYDDRYEQLLDDAEELIMEAVKWIEPEAE